MFKFGGVQFGGFLICFFNFNYQLVVRWDLDFFYNYVKFGFLGKGKGGYKVFVDGDIVYVFMLLMDKDIRGFCFGLNVLVNCVCVQ